MLRARLAAVAATALLLVAAMASGAEAASGNCPDAADVTVLPSPVSPWKGAPLRVMVVSEKPVQGVLSLIAPDGSVAAKSADRLGGSAPYSWFAEVAVPASGTWHATLTPDARRRNAVRSRTRSSSAPPSRSRRARRREPSGRCAIAGTLPPKRCSGHGSRSCSMRRPTRT